MTGPIFDTHAHYSARAFDADLLGERAFFAAHGRSTLWHGGTDGFFKAANRQTKRMAPPKNAGRPAAVGP